MKAKLCQNILQNAFLSLVCVLSLCACSGINDSWEVKGGGYIKYYINDGGERYIELERENVEIPYIKNSHHYFLVSTQAGQSDDGDQIAIMVNKPILGYNSVVQQYSSFTYQSLAKSPILEDSSTVHFDRKDDSTWTADLNLHVWDCRTGKCKKDIPRLHITGRLRYWIPEEWR